MITNKLTYADYLKTVNSLRLLNDKYLEINRINAETKKQENILRVYYPYNNSSHIKFYMDNERVIITDKQNIPVDLDSDFDLEVEHEGHSNKNKIEVDFGSKKTDKPEPKPEVETEPTRVKHTKYNQIMTCVKNDIPVYLVGEAGTGKNYTLQEISDELKLDFYFTNSVQQEYKITGFIDAGGVYHETEFYKAFTKGGIFFLDEIDASIPEVLVLLNAAIANRYFEFPNGKVFAHEDFRVVAAGNTVGSGANDLYTGRLVLDSATLDRFVIIEFDYDKEIELKLAKGNTNLVNFIRQLRAFAKRNGIRATFSYRCIITVTKLESAGLDINTILQIAVFKGLDTDTIKTFRLDISQGSCGSYYYGLTNLQKIA